MNKKLLVQLLEDEGINVPWLVHGLKVGQQHLELLQCTGLFHEDHHPYNDNQNRKMHEQLFLLSQLLT